MHIWRSRLSFNLKIVRKKSSASKVENSGKYMNAPKKQWRWWLRKFCLNAVKSSMNFQSRVQTSFWVKFLSVERSTPFNFSSLLEDIQALWRRVLYHKISIFVGPSVVSVIHQEDEANKKFLRVQASNVREYFLCFTSLFLSINTNTKAQPKR